MLLIFYCLSTIIQNRVQNYYKFSKFARFWAKKFIYARISSIFSPKSEIKNYKRNDIHKMYAIFAKILQL